MNPRKGPNIVEAMQRASAAVHYAAHGVETLEEAPPIEAENVTALGFVVAFEGECTIRFARIPFGPAGRLRWYILAERGPDVVATPCGAELAGDLERLANRAS